MWAVFQTVSQVQREPLSRPLYSRSTIALSVLASLIGAYLGARLRPVESIGATASGSCSTCRNSPL